MTVLAPASGKLMVAEDLCVRTQRRDGDKLCCYDNNNHCVKNCYNNVQKVIETKSEKTKKNKKKNKTKWFKNTRKTRYNSTSKNNTQK